MRRLVSLLAGLALLLTAAVVASSEGGMQAEAARWAITDLGTLGGAHSRADGINERGQIVGGADTAAGRDTWHGFVWQSGNMRDLGRFWPQSINNRGWILGHDNVWRDGKVIRLGTLGGKYGTKAEDLNNHGQVVGWSYVKSGTNHAFLWQNGTMRDLGTLGVSGSASHAEAVNDRGQVVGVSDTDLWEDTHHAFLWQSGKMRDLGTLGGRDSWGYAINDRGQVVGVADTKKKRNGFPIQHVFLWEDGKMRDLGFEGYPVAINERGQILVETNQGAMVWYRGRSRHLGTLGGDIDVSDLNDAGQVVGVSGTRYPNAHAFVWQNSTMTDLGVLRAGDEFSEALDVNGRGQIVGESARCNARSEEPETECHPRAVLWTLKRG